VQRPSAIMLAVITIIGTLPGSSMLTPVNRTVRTNGMMATFKRKIQRIAPEMRLS
jgi:hypothetical protein